MTRDPGEGVGRAGVVCTGVATGPVAAPFDEVLDVAVGDLVAALGGRLHGLYVYGSVATGQGRPPASDLDLYAVVNEPADSVCREVASQLSQRFVDVVREVGITTVLLDDVLAESLSGEAERCFIRHYCRPLAGHDLQQQLPDCVASVRLARGFNGDIGDVLDRIVSQLPQATPAGGESARRLVARGARKLLMAAATLLSARRGEWTTDRETGAELLAADAPQLTSSVGRVLDWCTLDTDGATVPPVVEVLSTFGALRDWLVTAYAAAAPDDEPAQDPDRPAAVGTFAPVRRPDPAVPVRAVILDIGGVLEDTPETGWVHRWEQRLNLSPGSLYERIEPLLAPGQMGTAVYDDIRSEVATALGLDPAASEAMWEELWAEYLGTLNAKLLAHVSALRPGVKVGLLSNSFVGAREREEDAYGFSRHVDTIIYSHEEGLAKPDPRFYLLASERLGVDPHEAVFVDDNEVCVTAARELGMTGILFTTEDGTIAAIDAALDGP